MTAQEDHPQFVILQDGIHGVGLHRRKRAIQLGGDLRGAVSKRRVPPDRIERAVARDLKEPGGGIFGHAVERPLLQRLEQRVLHDLLGEVQMRGTEDPGQPGDHLSRTLAKQMVHGSVGVAHWSILSMARTSMVPSYSKCGQSPARRTASSYVSARTM